MHPLKNELVIEQLFQYYDDIDCAVTVDQRITAKEQAELWLLRTLTKANEEGAKEAYEHAEIVRQRTLNELSDWVKNEMPSGFSEVMLINKIAELQGTPTKTDK